MAVTDRHRKARSVLVMLTAGGYKIEWARGQAGVPRTETARRQSDAGPETVTQTYPFPASAQIVIRRHGL